jgi:hypothetical protein
MSQRLPIPGGDDNEWGNILNSYLEVSHNTDGTLLPSAIVSAGSVISVNSISPSSGNINIGIHNLSDVIGVGSATNNQVLAYSTTTSAWSPATISGTVINNATSSAPGLVQLAGDLAPGTNGALNPEVTTVKAGRTPLTSDQNLFDVANVSTARTNLGLGTAATQASSAFDAAGTATSAVSTETNRAEAAEALAAQKTNNLSDLASVDTARGNLHVPELATAQAVVAANVSTMSGIPSSTVTDGATLAAGDIVLLIDQSTPSQNGPWVLATGSWTRPLDFPNGLVFRNRNIMVSQGSNYGGNVFQCLSESPNTVGTSSLSWALGSGGNPTASEVSVNDSQFQILQGTDTDLQTTLNDVDGLLSTTSATSSSNSSSISTLQSLVASSIQRIFQNSDNTWPSSTGPAQWIALGTYKGVWTTATSYQLNDIVTNSGSMYTANTAFTSGASFSADSGKWNQVPIQNGDQIISK